MHTSMILDTWLCCMCVYDAHIYDPGPRSWSMHVCMVHVSMMRQILSPTNERTNKAILGVGWKPPFLPDPVPTMLIARNLKYFLPPDIFLRALSIRVPLWAVLEATRQGGVRHYPSFCHNTLIWPIKKETPRPIDRTPCTMYTWVW